MFIAQGKCGVGLKLFISFPLFATSVSATDNVFELKTGKLHNIKRISGNGITKREERNQVWKYEK